MITISNTAIEVIRKNRDTKMKLALAFKKHYNTIENWINNRDAMLTTPDAVQIISEETGLTQEEILEDGDKAVA